MTDLRELIHTLHQRFSAADLSYGHGTDNAWDEAVALALGVTGCADDERELTCVVPQHDVDAALQLADRRVSERVPLAYLLGRWPLAGVEFLVEPGVVVPRSPIAFLLAEGLEPWCRQPPARVLDLCSGSGCLGILAAMAFPECSVQLSELDPQAADLAVRNVALHGLAERVAVRAGDLYDAVEGPFDLIIANPPYVDMADMSTLPAEFRAEPAMGLGAGADGLEVVRRILAEAAAYLAEGGTLVCEVGASAPALLRAYPDVPFIWPHLPGGGEGVFLLDHAALRSHTARLQ